MSLTKEEMMLLNEINKKLSTALTRLDALEKNIKDAIQESEVKIKNEVYYYR